ncbi:MAG: flippase [Ignavibacteriaceae bacterium]
MANRNSFIKNNLFVFSNRILSKIITFFLMLFLARQLSIDKFGELTILITMASIFALVQDLGTSVIVVRETAAKSFDSQKIFITTLFLKLISGFLCFWGMILTVRILGYNTDIKNLSYIFAVGLLGESFLLTLVKHYEGKEEMKYSSLLVSSERILIAVTIFFATKHFDLVFSYGCAYVVSNFSVFALGFFLTVQLKKIKNNINYNLLKEILKYSYPFIVFNFFSIIYYKVDIFIISHFFNDSQVGIYRASFQLIESIYFISLTLSVSLLPFFSRKNREEDSNLNSKYSLITKNILLLGLLISFILIPFSNIILSFLYKNKYLEGNVVFSILSITIPLYFAANIMGNLLIAIGKEKIQIASMVIGTFTKFILLLFLVHLLGITGAAISAVITDMILLVIQFWGTIKSGFQLSFDRNDLRKIIILIILTATVWMVKGYSILLVIPVGLYLFKDLIALIFKNLSLGRA